MKEIKKLKLEELNRINVEEFREKDKMPVRIILDNIRSGLNVGSIFRTADAYLVEKIHLCGITARPPHKEILKTAIGATDSVDWDYSDTIYEVVQYLKNEGFTIIGIEQTSGSIELSSYPINKDKKYAIILGNEVEGVQEEIMKEIDQFIELAQFGTKHSLNVAVCGGIVIHKFAEHYLL